MLSVNKNFNSKSHFTDSTKPKLSSVTISSDNAKDDIAYPDNKITLKIQYKPGIDTPESDHIQTIGFSKIYFFINNKKIEANWGGQTEVSVISDNGTPEKFDQITATTTVEKCQYGPVTFEINFTGTSGGKIIKGDPHTTTTDKSKVIIYNSACCPTDESEECKKENVLLIVAISVGVFIILLIIYFFMRKKVFYGGNRKLSSGKRVRSGRGKSK